MDRPKRSAALASRKMLQVVAAQAFKSTEEIEREDEIEARAMAEEAAQRRPRAGKKPHNAPKSKPAKRDVPKAKMHKDALAVTPCRTSDVALVWPTTHPDVIYEPVAISLPVCL